MLIPFAIAAALRRIDIVSVYDLWHVRTGWPSGLVFLSHGNRWYAAFAPHLQVAADERLEITIEYAVDVADLDARTEVLRHSIRLQNVAANLRAEVDLQLRVFELLARRALLLEFVFIEPRAKHLHGFLFVLMLRALVLASCHKSSRKMRDSHGGVGGVDVLSALSAGTVGVDAKLVGLDVDLNRVVDFGRDEDAREARVPALCLVEWRDADQAVHAGLARQQTERVLTRNGESCRLDAGFVAVL